MCLTSHWARKCINCYSKQRAILGALVQKKYFSVFLSETPCAAGEGAVCSGSESTFLGDFVDRRAWTLLGKQQQFDEGLISEMAWWFSLLWRPNKAALPKSATRYPVLFQTRRIRVDYDFGRLDSGKRFSLELNRESWCLQRTRDVFYNSYIPALDPALISDSTVKTNSMNLWSVLYFWVRQALWCKCTLRTLWGESLTLH